MDFDLFVIGGGSAGVRCGRIAAGHGARVGVAEERFWGGTCVNVGCVPKKLLVQAGEYGAWADDAAGFGWTITKGPHDWAKLIAAKDREIGRLNGIYRNACSTTPAPRCSRRVPASSIRTRSTSAASASPRSASSSPPAAIRCAWRSPAPNSASSRTMRSICRTCRSASRSLGSGYIAVEFAGIFAGLGAHVDLVYRQPLPLRGFDHDMREALAEALTQQGITLHPGCTPREIERRRRCARVLHLSNGATLHTDLVFFATGRKPATQNARPRQGGRNDRTTQAR